MFAERWQAPRLSLHDSLLEFPGRHLQNGPAHSKEPLFKWDLDITRTGTEDLVGISHLLCISHSNTVMNMCNQEPVVRPSAMSRPCIL